MGSRSYSRLVRPYILALTISTDCVLLMERRARAFSSSISPPLTQRFGLMPSVSALPPKADMVQHDCDVRFVPCVDGSELARRIFTSQSWSVQPCVRPLSAVHMTAGHNALRGSGPGQKDAFNSQRLAKGTEPCGIGLGRLSSKQADYWHCRLLRARRERPCHRSTTHQSYEFPSPHRAPQAEDHSLPHRERCCAVQQNCRANVRFTPKSGHSSAQS